MTHDGLGKYLSQIIKKAPGPTADIVGILKDRKTDVVITYLPVGSEEATKWYVEQALQAGVRLRQLHPGLHRPRAVLAAALRGAWPADHRRRHQVPGRRHHHPPRPDPPVHGPRRAIDRTYQLNFGGNTDFLNMLERERLESKKISKTNAVTSHARLRARPGRHPRRPGDYVPWLKDRKWCHIRMEGTTFGDVPLNLELKLEVWDSPELRRRRHRRLRCVKLGSTAASPGAGRPRAYFMKSPPDADPRRRGP